MRRHIQAFAAIGSVPIEIHYDRSKTLVTVEKSDGYIVYQQSLLALAKHYGFLSLACRPYRVKTKGKVERPFSYIRWDFFLVGTFCDLDDLNIQLSVWLDTIANVRLHGTTRRIVLEAFVKRLELQPLPAEPFDTLRKLEQRVRHDGLISISGNYYSVPDRTQQVVEVHKLPQTICIVDGGWLVASHSILEGRRQYRVDPEQQQGAAARAMLLSRRSADVAIASPRARCASASHS